MISDIYFPPIVSDVSSQTSFKQLTDAWTDTQDLLCATDINANSSETPNEQLPLVVDQVETELPRPSTINSFRSFRPRSSEFYHIDIENPSEIPFDGNLKVLPHSGYNGQIPLREEETSTPPPPRPPLPMIKIPPLTLPKPNLRRFIPRITRLRTIDEGRTYI